LRFLIDADLPRAATPLLRRHGHDAVDVRDVGLAAATDSEIARRARDERRCLVTGDFGFADVMQQPEILARLDGRLAIVEPGRLRLRPP